MLVHIALDDVDILATEEDETEEHSETEEGGDDDVVNPVLPTGWEMVWAAIFFGLLWALMKYVLLPPILGQRQSRQEKILADREAADRAQQALGEAQDEYDAALAKARSEADAIIDAARDEAGAHRAELMGEANDSIASLRSEAASELDTGRTAAIASLRNDVGDIAVSAASAVLGKNIDRQAAQPAIDAALNGGGTE